MLSLAVATVAAIWSTSTTPWDNGDVLLAIYFGFLSAALGIQAARLRLARATPAFTRTVVIAVTIVVAIGVLLTIVDIATSGRV